MDLRRLILVLTLVSAIIPFAHTFYAGYSTQREQLMENALQANAAYAKKLAKSTDDFLQSALQQLGYTAGLLSMHMDNETQLLNETTRLRMQTKSFNSVAIYNHHGTVLATSPENFKLLGFTLQSDTVQDSLRLKKAIISQPYLSAAGNLIVFLSHPIFSPQGDYLGAVGGSIYLKQENMLDRLLGEHFYKDGSYLYVVDSNKRVLYHPSTERVGEFILNNPVVNQIATGQSGKVAVTNSKGLEMLAGFAVVPSTGWGIVSQRPLASTLAPLDDLVRNMLYRTLPMALAMLLLIWWGARRIAKPLRQLANGAQQMDRAESAQTIQSVHSWYYEAQELKRAMLVGVGLLHKSITKLRQDVNTDPLTGLGNRRHLDAALANFARHHQAFAVVAVDIDHFKKVNDQFGHDVGDQVIKQLAQQMRVLSRTDDVACRVGGEEFVMVLPGAPLHVAAQVAERLRSTVEGLELPAVGRITISQGVSHWPETSDDVPTVFKQADAMLYAAKHAGRNRVAVFQVDAAAPAKAL